ncbi:hypothetical protein GCM10027074_03660 [Streptomyces deserti]
MTSLVPGGEACAVAGVMTRAAVARARAPERDLRAMCGFLLHRRHCGERKAQLKALAESFSNLAVTQMLKARHPKGQRAVRDSRK